MIEQALKTTSKFEDLETKFMTLLASPSEVPTVALKTIMAYRGGLSILDPSIELAKNEFSGLKEFLKTNQGQSSSIRIERCHLHHYLLLRAFEFAGEHNLPVQIHTGLGDADEDLSSSNPLLLKNLFENKHFSQVKFVLLHCYPFVREAAYLASLYPNVYMDLSLACFLVSANIDSILQEAISLAPISKILTGTDGHTVPETHWYGARSIKRGLAQVLSKLVSDDLLDPPQAMKVAGDILHGNARQLYKLEGLA